MYSCDYKVGFLIVSEFLFGVRVNEAILCYVFLLNFFHSIPSSILIAMEGALEDEHTVYPAESLVVTVAHRYKQSQKYRHSIAYN